LSTEPSMADVEFDAEDLYLEETFTDRKVGTIRRLTPVKTDGTPDRARAVLFSGQTQLLTPMGAVPIAFDIEARDLQEAIARYPEGMRAAVDRTVEEVRELRRQAASQIVVPEMGGAGGLPGGGVPGGGKIQIP